MRLWFPWRAMLRDPECSHLIRAWSSGKLERHPIQDVFKGIEDCDVILRQPNARKVGWSLDLQELVHILAVARLTKSTRILEIGTYDGFTTLNLASNLPAGEIWTLDLEPDRDRTELLRAGILNAASGKSIGQKFRDQPENGKIHQLWGDSTKLDWSNFGPPFDLILIDGCHEFSFVMSDSLHAIERVRPGGVVFWHDYGQAVDVSKAVDELSLIHPIAAIRGTRLACLKKPI